MILWSIKRHRRFACKANFIRGDRGNIAPIFALLMIPMLGLLGIATEASGWYFSKGSLQNATDAAAMAAAANIAGGSTPATCNSTDTPATGTPCAEVRGVFANYGYTNGTGGNNVTIKTTAGVTCPSGAVAGTCYKVEVTKLFPIRMLAVTGFKGDTQVGPARYQSVYATATIGQSTTAGAPYCLISLSQASGDGIVAKGVPSADLTGCAIMSNSNASCNGQGLKADVANAHGTADTICSSSGTVNNGIPLFSDPYDSLKSNIPTDDGCSSNYPQQPKKTPLPNTNLWSGNLPWNNTIKLCGDQQLTGSSTIKNNTTVIIYNGHLDLNGNTLSTDTGVSATIVFAGSNGAYEHTPTGNGTLDIVAPTSGPWANVVMYQAPNLTQNVDISEAGNAPNWSMTGLVYLPNSNLTFKGAVGKGSKGKACFGLIAYTITVKGTGFTLAKGECALAGLTLPASSLPGRMVLLQ